MPRLPCRGLVAALFVFTAALASTPVPSDRDTAELQALEKAWNDAIVRKDVAFPRELLADDFVFISPAGQVVRKDGLIAMVASPETIVHPLLTEEVEVRVYGDAAVMTGRFKQEGTHRGRPLTANLRYTDAYVRRAGRWIAVTAHAVVIPAPAVTPAAK